jgi:hypothetical protein
VNYVELLEYSVYVGCVAPLALLGLRALVLFGWSLLKRWGTT